MSASSGSATRSSGGGGTSAAPAAATGLVLRAHRAGVTTLTMNHPAKLNGWTRDMMLALREALGEAAADPSTRVVVLTGTDPYYSAGVNLAGALGWRDPRALREELARDNQALFDLFIEFDKPLLAAVNGPAIGATVTTASLCDAILASEKATFSTPFARLGLPAEGCSSVMFPRRLGEAVARRLLGPEGWRPTGREAVDIGLARWVVPHEHLLAEAQRIGEAWVAEGRPRTRPATREELLAINAEESQRIADAFLATPFLRAQYRFLWSRGKRLPAATFFALRVTHPLWSRLLR